MGSSKTLKKTVERAQKEIKKLLTEVRTSKPDTSKLETGLKEVKGNLKVLDIHLHKRDDE
jgi:predicted RNase H-like nuclease (RuvC/YqgF family)